MNDEHARHDALNAIAAGKAHAQLMERRVLRGTACRADLSDALRNICVAFDRLTEFCEQVKLLPSDLDQSKPENRVQLVLIPPKKR